MWELTKEHGNISKPLMIYLDCAASTPLHPRVLDELERAQRDDFANPSSAHKLARDLNKKIEAVEMFIRASLGGGEEDYLVFTSGATEANNALIKGLPLSSGDEILLTQADHPSLIVPAKEQSGRGALVKEYPLDSSGEIDGDSLLKLTTSRTRLILLSSVNSQSGNWHNLESLVGQIKDECPGVHIHVDVTQSFTKLPLELEGIDSVAFSGHKIGGPKGIGGLCGKKSVMLKPLFHGGGQQEGRRSSTLPAPLILALAKAVEVAMEAREENFSKAREKNIVLRKKLLERVPRLIFPFPPEKTSPYILTFVCPGIPSDIVLRHLEKKDIFLSSTSACSSKKKGPNRTFAALGIDPQWHESVLRLSFSQGLGHREVDDFVDSFGKIVGQLSFLIQ